MDDDGWDAYAADWDDDEGARAYAGAAFDGLLPLVREAGIGLDGARVIDFGCGTGLLTERLVAAGAVVDAVDTSPAMLRVLEDKVAARGMAGVTTSGTMPASGRDHDLIVCSSVCSFLDDYPGAVVDLVARLRPGGLFVQWDWERGDDDDHGLSRAEIGDALGAAGLEDIVVEVAFDVTVDGEAMRPLVGHGRRPATGPEIS